ncbi:MAG: type IV pilus twitching motility protein PilT [Bulleidia sp.]
MTLTEEFVSQAAERNASDIHIAAGLKPRFRIDGQLIAGNDHVLSEKECMEMAEELAGEEFDAIRNRGELDLARTIAGRRVRVNIYHTRGTISIALRILADVIPEIRDLGLPPAVSMFPSYQKGIVLVTGETGSGKSTTLAAILNEINHTRNEHIITLEDPIEYLYEPDRCLISQREIGTDTESYADGLRAILREDPDIILIGEMRDAETIETALTAAETGHLVFATLHTNSAADSIDRIIGVFSAERQPEIRLQLSTVLMAVLSQQLLVRKGGHGRACACEVMIATPAIRNQIREGKTPQMESSILTSAKEGSLTMDNCLIQMVKNGIIDADTASSAARKPENVAAACGGMRSSSEYRRI